MQTGQHFGQHCPIRSREKFVFCRGGGTKISPHNGLILDRNRHVMKSDYRLKAARCSIFTCGGATRSIGHKIRRD